MSETNKDNGRIPPVRVPESTRIELTPPNVYLDAEGSTLPIDAESLTRFILCLLETAGESDAEISLSLVDDRAIRELNHQYRGQDCPTDVLSFSLREGEPVGQQFALGDLVVSVETAQRQAEQFGNRFDEEIGELVFHGFLHLLGYDHDGPARREWDSAEARLIEGLRRRQSLFCPKGMSPQDVIHP
jgi:probable rRNA maturation factor